MGGLCVCCQGGLWVWRCLLSRQADGGGFGSGVCVRYQLMTALRVAVAAPSNLPACLLVPIPQGPVGCRRLGCCWCVAGGCVGHLLGPHGQAAAGSTSTHADGHPVSGTDEQHEAPQQDTVSNISRDCRGWRDCSCRSGRYELWPALWQQAQQPGSAADKQPDRSRRWRQGWQRQYQQRQW